MQATGWTFRAQSAVAAGTTSLTITKPTGTVDGDIMFMWLTHKGSAYATMPAGWTLVARNVSSGLRGELHWRRASSEGASYSVTGLLDTALGMIASYIGGLISGSVIDVSDSIANASGVRTSPQVTTTIPEALILSSIHVAANVTVGNQGTGESNGNTNLFDNFGEWDEQLLRLRTLTDTGTANGTDCRLEITDACKVIPDVTGALAVSSAYTGANVRIVAAFIPETSQVSAGTRYYASSEIVPKRINEEVAGDWDSATSGPDAYANVVPAMRLAPRKTQCFHLTTADFVTNRQGNYDEIIGRYVSNPLEAQSISGTIDLSFFVRSDWLDNIIGLTNQTHACYKLHVYITQGETGVVRHVLLNNYIDANEFPRHATQTWQGLASAQSLTAGNALDGDTLVVELGVRLISSPTPAPTEPPTEYSRISFGGIDATLAGNNTSTMVGTIDSTQGTTTTARVGWIDFSQTIVEKAQPASPANTTFAGAQVIGPTLPLTITPIDVRSADSNARTLWFSWTPDASGNANIYLNGSNYHAQIVVLTGTPGSFGGPDEYQTVSSAIQRGLTHDAFDAVQGTTYYICVYLTSFTSAQAGELWMTITFRDVVPAEGDLYIPNNDIYSYRNGLPVNWGALNFQPAGCAIDYSHLPMYDIEFFDGTLNTTDRIFIASFGGSSLVEILELPTLSRDRSEVDFLFDAYDLDGNDGQNAAALAINPATNDVILGNWGAGFLDVNDEGTSVNQAFLDSPSVDPANSALYRCSILNGDFQGNLTPGLPVAAERFDALTVDATTPWYPALENGGGSIVYYASDGFYIAPRTPPVAFVIRAYNLDTNTQLPNVATIPASTSPIAAAGLHGIAVHVDGTLFVCNQNEVLRVQISDGSILQTYTATGDFPYDGQQLYDVHITPDGQSIIAIDGTSMTVFEWNITTGVQTTFFQTWLAQGNFTQFAIYQPNPLPEPAPECPGEILRPQTDGLPYTPVVVPPCEGDGERSGQETGQ